jgi:predicted small lipoprotein YifL
MVPRMHAESSLSRPYLRLAIIGALAAALGLAGCGRKGPLDPPPTAAAPGAQPQATSQPAGIMAPFGSPSPSGGQTANSGSAGVDPSGQAIAPKGEHKRIPLDSLLN